MRTTTKVLPTLMCLGVMGLSACSGINPIKPEPQKVSTSCELSGTKKLDLAVEDAKSRLDSGCLSRYDDYYNALLNVATGDPKSENKGTFQHYLRWSVNEGIVSRVQAGELYDRYFSKTYTTLDRHGSVAASVCPQIDKVMSDLQKELKNKELGIRDVAADSKAYQSAVNLYYELELNLEAICAATADRVSS